MRVWAVIGALVVLYVNAISCEDCLYQMELWAAEDPTKFHYCNPATNQTDTADCLFGTGFVRNETVSGCVKWTEWNDACVSKVDATTYTCGADMFLQPHSDVNPRIFYLCWAENQPPVQLMCPEDRAFYAKDDYLGCFPWDMWKNLTKCAL